MNGTHPTRARSDMLSCGQCATLACLLEAIAPKPGNVHRAADFEDLRFADLAVSAVLISPVMESASGRSLGQTVLDSVQATRRLVPTNTNLGMILLLAPLAAVPRSASLRAGVCRVLGSLTAGDARDVYAAIRLASPGGLGETAEMDVAGEPPANLLDAMAQAGPRDLVARQYVTGFADVFDRVVPWLEEDCGAGRPLSSAIVHTHVRLMAEFPDSLIARKCGEATAREAQARAGLALSAGEPGDAAYHQALGELDFWLRCDGHRRNPGTTADLIAAGLFVGLREQTLLPPWH